jgi:hypothetical protein
MDHTLAPSHPGTVVLDLGGDTGALIVYTGPGQHGQEIEISPITEPVRRTHAAVRERRLAGRSAYCAVYPGLVAGEYTVWHDTTTPAATVTVTGGAVSELRLPIRVRAFVR